MSIISDLLKYAMRLAKTDVLSLHERSITSELIGYDKALMKCGLIRSKVVVLCDRHERNTGMDNQIG